MNKTFGALYVINIVSQAIFTLLVPTAVFFFAAWLLISKLSAPSWIYAVFIPLGVIIGFYGMVKFSISASENLERLERQKRKRINKDNTEINGNEE